VSSCRGEGSAALLRQPQASFGALSCFIGRSASVGGEAELALEFGA
jgi:hypothetical protein